MVPPGTSAILLRCGRAGLPFALFLFVSSTAAPAADGEDGRAAPPPRGPAMRAWFEVPIPCGAAALAQAAGLDPATEPWRLLPDLTRRLHAPYGERIGPRVTAQVVAALGGPAPATAPATASLVAASDPSLRAPTSRVSALAGMPVPLPSVEGEGTAMALMAAAGPVATAEAPADGARVPVPLTRESWRRILGNERRTGRPRDLLAALATDHRAARLFRGLLALEGGTLEVLAREPGVLRQVLQRQASAFSVFAASFRVERGRVAVPGGHEAAALWQEMVGASVLDPQEFLLRLGSGQGQLFSFYDAVDRLDDARRRFALAATEPDPRRRLERVRALRAVFAGAEPWWTDVRPPYSRPPADAARVLAAVRVTPSGALAEPSAEALWTAAFDDQADASPPGRARPRPPRRPPRGWTVRRRRRALDRGGPAPRPARAHGGTRLRDRGERPPARHGGSRCGGRSASARMGGPGLRRRSGRGRVPAPAPDAPEAGRRHPRRRARRASRRARGAAGRRPRRSRLRGGAGLRGERARGHRGRLAPARLRVRGGGPARRPAAGLGDAAGDGGTGPALARARRPPRPGPRPGPPRAAPPGDRRPTHAHA